MLTAALFSPDFKIVVYIYEVFKLFGTSFPRPPAASALGLHRETPVTQTA